MNSVLPALAASAIALGSSPQPASRDVCPLNIPATAAAARSTELLRRAAHAVCDLARSRDEQIASLWVYPTRTANTVFVQYSSRTARSPVNVKHLALAEIDGDRITHWRTLP
jgi:hypothetical protein